MLLSGFLLLASFFFLSSVDDGGGGGGGASAQGRGSDGDGHCGGECSQQDGAVLVSMVMSTPVLVPANLAPVQSRIQAGGCDTMLSIMLIWPDD